MSAREAFARIPDISLLELDVGNADGRGGILGRATGLLNAGSSLVSLARWCRKNRVTVVHVTERPRQALFGLLLARMSGCACLIHAHISIYPHDATRFAKWRLQQADAVVGVSRFTAGTYQRLAEIPPSRVFAVHNSVDGAVFHPDTGTTSRRAMREHLGIPATAPLIGCVARLMRWKGQETLLDAFAMVRQQYPDVQLVLAGLSADQAPDGLGDYKDYLVRRIGALGLEGVVKLPGFVPRSQMPEFYAALDVLAHPSTEEPFGLAVVEALACSRPVVAVDGGGIPEIIRNRVDGVLVPAEQPQPMAAEIVNLLDNPALAKQLACAGRKHVLDMFSPELQAAKMLEVYQQLRQRG
jgi:glycosyltransferase involved in cell wall biosynthesis